MAAYERFAAFYDDVMDDPGPRAARVIESIDRYHPGARSLLELGCGTGSMLGRLPGMASVTGLDRSPQMLAIAATKVPRAQLLRGDMASFSLGRQFDVVLCAFDSLNHLLSFDAWLSTFDSVLTHLTEGGLFVFDVNTLGELRRLGDDPPAVYDFDRGVAIIDVAFADDGEGAGISEWDVRVFEDLGEGRYRLHRERIGELGIGLATLQSAVESRFDLLELTDEGQGSASDDSIKAHFVARRRPGRGPGTSSPTGAMRSKGPSGPPITKRD
jgi:SAM-dependent methyltransferase